MKKLIIFVLTLFSVGFYFTGCDPFEEYESSEVLPQPTATLAVSNVADSSFTLDISTDKAGVLGYVVSSDSASSIQAISILSLSLEGGANIEDIQTFEMGEGGGSTSVDVSGLMPNSYYKVHVASMNNDGVESNVETASVKTDDGVGPTFMSSTPSVSNAAAIAVGTDIVLSFDEPVKVDSNKTFTFTYFYEDVTAEISLDDSNVSGNEVTVPQSHSGHAGDYFFLSWEAGAVTDLSGNPCDERISGIIDGYLAGNYYRFEKIPFSVPVNSVVPANGSVISADDTAVEINFPFAVSLAEELGTDMVKFKYTGFDGKVTTLVSSIDNCEIVNDTTLRITQTHVPSAGDNIALYLAEGVVLDAYGNPNEVSDYVLNWDLPRLTIDALVGQYIVSGASYWEPYPVVTDTVSIEINEDEPNSVLVTGLFKNMLGSSQPVVGYFDAANSVINIAEQIIGSDESQTYTVFSNVTDDYSINVSIVDDGVMTSDLVLGIYDSEFNWSGYGEYLPEVTWTKMSTKSASKNSSVGKVVNSIMIKETSKGIK